MQNHSLTRVKACVTGSLYHTSNGNETIVHVSVRFWLKYFSTMYTIDDPESSCFYLILFTIHLLLLLIFTSTLDNEYLIYPLITPPIKKKCKLEFSSFNFF